MAMIFRSGNGFDWRRQRHASAPSIHGRRQADARIFTLAGDNPIISIQYKNIYGNSSCMYILDIQIHWPAAHAPGVNLVVLIVIWVWLLSLSDITAIYFRLVVTTENSWTHCGVADGLPTHYIRCYRTARRSTYWRKKQMIERQNI